MAPFGSAFALDAVLRAVLTFRAAAGPWAHRAWLCLLEKGLPFEEEIVDLADKPEHFKEKYAELSPVPTARAKVPILEVGAEGEEGYFALIESEVVARFIAREWPEHGTQLIPPSPADEALMNLFVTVFMEEVSGLSFSFLGAKSDEAVAKGYEKLLGGLQSVENCLNVHGNEEGGSFFFGGQYTLAEALTAPFVIRMSANFPVHRGVDIIENCERAGFDRCARWIQAVLARESSIASTPAHNSLVMLAPYMQPFFEGTVSEEAQTAAFEKLEQSAADAEAAWEAQLAEGNAITAEAHKARGNKVHESIARSAAKAKL